MSDFLTLSKNNEPNGALELVFLGTSAAIQVPSFHCTCEICETSRQTPEHHRTRASAVLLGKETVLIDAGPDMEFQLEREAIRRLDRIFITHWHYDHFGGILHLMFAGRLPNARRIPVYMNRFCEKNFENFSDNLYMEDVPPRYRPFICVELIESGSVVDFGEVQVMPISVVA